MGVQLDKVGCKKMRKGKMGWPCKQVTVFQISSQLQQERQRTLPEAVLALRKLALLEAWQPFTEWVKGLGWGSCLGAPNMLGFLPPCR